MLIVLTALVVVATIFGFRFYRSRHRDGSVTYYTPRDTDSGNDGTNSPGMNGVSPISNGNVNGTGHQPEDSGSEQETGGSLKGKSISDSQGKVPASNSGKKAFAAPKGVWEERDDVFNNSDYDETVRYGAAIYTVDEVDDENWSKQFHSFLSANYGNVLSADPTILFIVYNGTRFVEMTDGWDRYFFVWDRNEDTYTFKQVDISAHDILRIKEGYDVEEGG